MAPTISPTPATIPPPRPAPTDPVAPFNAWLNALNELLGSGASSSGSLSSLFLADSYWRDHLCLSWEYKTAHTLSNIQSLLSSNRIESITVSRTHSTPISVAPVDFEGNVPAIAAFVDVKTKVGHGQGVIRLLEDLEGGRKWKAYTVFTALMGLEKYPERVGRNRPNGVTHGADMGRRNWSERRKDEKEFVNEQPTVLIVGAGHSGLVTAARLKMMGIPTLVVDRNKRVGDNWRRRYHQLVLHDPVQYDHMPYLSFPANWPKFTPKDKLGDWFEFYASALELNVWTESEISASSYDEKAKCWNVTISRPSGTRELQPRHIILATGHSGEPNMPDIDTSKFKGDVLCHSSAFPGAKRDGTGRKAVVVGCCNSGHDIAQDFYEKGYDVTIVQRSSTYVMSSENGVELLLKGLYDEDGPPLEDADLLFMSSPIPLLKRNQIYLTQEIERRDTEILDGLRKAGFTLDRGPNDAGMFVKYLERGGGYYFDVGASSLIATGGIKIKKIAQIEEIQPDGIRFDDASGFLPADEIVFATGYANMKTTAEKILGKQVLEGVEEIWGVDSESGEIRGMWMQTRPGLWFMGGNLGLTRWFSRMVAIGVAAIEGGLVEG